VVATRPLDAVDGDRPGLDVDPGERAVSNVAPGERAVLDVLPGEETVGADGSDRREQRDEGGDGDDKRRTRTENLPNERRGVTGRVATVLRNTVGIHTDPTGFEPGKSL
jgi:hypothetical protein